MHIVLKHSKAKSAANKPIETDGLPVGCASGQTAAHWWRYEEEILIESFRI
jgi:hypothetical protein